jgi:NAD(P)-dependent dehydrogenase (short-subunit alcohol dehydrogenase family)
MNAAGGDLRFDGRVAIVTGAGGGLGRAHAQLLASRGAKVVVNDLGGSVTGDGADRGPAETTAEDLRQMGFEAVADTHTVSTPEGGQAIVATALETFGRVDVLVNNAGIIRDAPFDDMTPDLVDPLLDVHLRGAFHVTRPAWSAMRRQGYGRIVNTTSASGLIGNAGQSNYGAAKAGIFGLTRILALEGAAHGIQANAIAPTATTRMLLGAMHEDEAVDPAALDAMRAFMPRLDPARVSPVVAFLAHESCPVTGEAFSVGGGNVSRYFLGRTAGFSAADLSVEDVRDHLDEILDESGYTVPATPADEMALLFESVMRQTPRADDRQSPPPT